MIAGMNTSNNTQLDTLADLIKEWGIEQGFAQVGISDVDVSTHKAYLQTWLEKNHHGEMSYMQRNQALRNYPEQLQVGALRSISFRMEYRHNNADMESILNQSDKAYISRYALGRDYHKLIRKRLANIAQRISEHSQLNLNQRAFVDSAPVLERALAEKSGLGWIGKNTMLINPKAGSWFFLGEILTDLALPIDPVEPSVHCGSCTACLDICPTNAFIGANQLDARKCISYLTIEYKGSIPLELRPLMGNRIYGCDDCQIVCPWNKFSPDSNINDFKVRHALDDTSLLTLFNWSETQFLKNTEGSPIRRIGYEQWQRNIAVALGNARFSADIVEHLENKLSISSELVNEHILWALSQHAKSSY